MVYIIVILVLILGYFLVGNYFYDYGLNARKDKSKVLKGNSDTDGFNRSINENQWFLENCKEVYMQSSTGAKLVGYEFINQGSNKWVIVLHGYFQEAKIMSLFVKKFYDRGYNVFAPDLLGHGKSGGDAISMGGLDSNDVVLWAERIAAKHKEAKIVLFGISMGAATVLNTVGKRLPKNVIGFINDSGYVKVDDVFSHQLKKLFNIPRFLVIPAASFVTKLRAGYSFAEVDASEGLKKTQLPGLTLHGDKDDFVPLENANMVEELMKARCEKHIFKDAIHCQAAFIYPNEYWQIIDDFLASLKWNKSLY